jgi:peptidoglycan/xylan/chitin deacetylase (PgdA/CDA1 family)
MTTRVTTIVKSGLSALHYSKADVLFAPMVRPRGAIVTLHQVSPDPTPDFSPNRILRVTPDFLEQSIRYVLEAGFEVIALDEISERLQDTRERRPFICFTLDDGYKDNLQHAYPIFKRYGIPFAIYVPTDYPDGQGDLWWLALEEAMRRLKHLTVDMGRGTQTFKLDKLCAKAVAFHEIYWWLRSLDETVARALVVQWCADAGFDAAQLCSSMIMNWDEIGALAKDPLVTIGAHTRRHFAVAKLSVDDSRAEIVESMAIISKLTGRPCRHFSFPYGDETAAGPRDFALARDAGLTTAVTTRKGLIHAHHADALTALPRLSLNGDYQDIRYLKVLLSGLPFAILNAARHLPGLRQRAAAL